jgi:hypothetical protein
MGKADIQNRPPYVVTRSIKTGHSESGWCVSIDGGEELTRPTQDIIHAEVQARAWNNALEQLKAEDTAWL